jgi:hypothetical protein
MKEPKMKTFERHDLYLASVPKINGFKLVNVRQYERGRGVFVFGEWDDRPRIVRNYYISKERS